jgi:hypothetical protein
MIRSFRVEVLFQYPVLSSPVKPGTVVFDSYTAVKLPHLCDQLHLLVARLLLKQGPIFRASKLPSSFHASMSRNRVA